MKNSPKFLFITRILALLVIVVLGYYIFTLKTQKASPGIPALTLSQLEYARIPNFPSEKKEMIQLMNGEYNKEVVDGDIKFHTFIKLTTTENSYAVADMDNDGTGDIVAMLGYSGGGTGFFNMLTIFRNNNGMPEYLTSKEIGDRLVINKVSAENQVITVDYITQGPDEPMCCGTLRKVSKFKLEGNTLIEQGE